ncbi:MAG: MFS transporter [Pseudomonadota bacterium]
MIGSGVSTIALALLAIDIAPERASTVLGIALAIKMIAYVTVAPFAGVLSARLPARQCLIGLDVLRAGVVFLMPWIVSEWQIYMAIGVVSAASALFTPTYQALLPAVVKNEKAYLKALSWAQVAGSVEQIASPLLAAVLLTIISFSDLFYLNAFTFVVSAVLIGLTTLLHSPTASAATDPWWGIIAYLKTPRLRAVALAYIGVAAASAMVIVNTAVFVQQHLGESASTMSLTLAAAGLGTALGAMLVPRSSWSPRTLLVVGNFVMAGSILAGVFGANWQSLALMWLGVGLGLGLVQTPVGAVVRASCHERHRPAFFAANFTVSHACWLFTYLFAGLMGAIDNWPVTFAVMGLIPLAAGIACAAAYPQPDVVALEHRHGNTVHRHDYFIDESHTSWPR